MLLHRRLRVKLNELSEEEMRTSETATRCDECGRSIPPGEEFFHLYQQEHEGCQQCGAPWEDWEEPHKPCQDGDCDFGETCEYQCCLWCHNLLKAIHDEEIALGCPEHASQPYLFGLSDAMWESDNWKAYGVRARAMFPELPDDYLVKMLREDRKESDQ